MRILVILDDKKQEKMYAALLMDGRYLMDAVQPEKAVDDAASGIYDAAVVDISQEKSIQLLKNMRSAGIHTPILMICAEPSIDRKVDALDNGADAFLAKPFEARELLSQLRALVRRRDGIVSELLSFGNTSLNIMTCMLCSDTDVVQLSSREFEMMRILMTNKDNIVPKEVLLLKVWGYESNAIDNYVEVYISYLRKRLKEIHSNVRINAVRRVGYHLSVAETVI